jgi:hypothetical protein
MKNKTIHQCLYTFVKPIAVYIEKVYRYNAGDSLPYPPTDVWSIDLKPWDRTRSDIYESEMLTHRMDILTCLAIFRPGESLPVKHRAVDNSRSAKLQCHHVILRGGQKQSS